MPVGKEEIVLSTPPLSLSDEAREETQKIRRLRTLVDMVSELIRTADLPLAEAVVLVRGVRRQALAIFPGKERTFDLIYAPRFARVLQETYRIEVPEN